MVQKNILWVSDDKDPIQQYVLTVLANTLQQYSYTSYLHLGYTLSDDLVLMIRNRSITHVIINDFIIPPDHLQTILEKCRNVKFFIRDVNTHTQFDNAQIFNLVKIYALLGVKILTQRPLIYDFGKNLPSTKLNKNLVCWAPDLFLVPCQSFNKEVQEFRTPLRIGHYNRHGIAAENTTFQYLGCSNFSLKYNVPVDFRILSVNQLTPWKELTMLSCTQEKNFPDTSLTLLENLTVDTLSKEIEDLDIFLHVSKMNTYYIDYMAIKSDIPIITSRNNLILGKYASCKDNGSMEDLSLTLKKIYRESMWEKKRRLFKQKISLLRYGKRVAQIWLKLLRS